MSLEIRKHDIHILQFQQSFPRANVAIFGFPTVLAPVGMDPFPCLFQGQAGKKVVCRVSPGGLQVPSVERIGKMITWCRKMMILFNDASKGLLSGSCFMLFFLVVQYFFCVFLLGCWCWKSTFLFNTGKLGALKSKLPCPGIIRDHLTRLLSEAWTLLPPTVSGYPSNVGIMPLHGHRCGWAVVGWRPYPS